MLLATSWAVPALGQSDELMEGFNRAGELYEQGRYAEAIPFTEKALNVGEKEFGSEHAVTGMLLSGLSEIFRQLGRYAKAEPLYQRALAIFEKALGPDHPSVALALNNLAGLYEAQGRLGDALTWSRRATTIRRTRFTGTGVKETAGLISEQKGARLDFSLHIDLALLAGKEGKRSALEAEAFEVVQLARTSAASGAVARMAVRFASGDDAVAGLVRELQDARARYEGLDQKLIQSLGAPPEERNTEAVTGIRSELDALKGRIVDLEKQITEQFPRYAELTRAETLTHVFVIGRDQATAYTVELGAEALEWMVAILRGGVELQNVERLSNLPDFDITEVYELYEMLLSPSEPYLKGVEHLFVIPDGAVMSRSMQRVEQNPPINV
jgi:hypothetical protein